MLCARCLLGVEKAGRNWVQEEIEVNDVKEAEEVKEKDSSRLLREELGRFGDENMGKGSMWLARW